MWSAATNATLRSKCPLPWNLTIVTFAYVDPGHQTHTELYSWGAAHGPLWDALREKGRRVRVIGIAVENAILDRTNRVLEKWAAAEPGATPEGPTPEQEIKTIRDAMKRNDLGRIWSNMEARGKAMKRCGGAHENAPRSQKLAKLRQESRLTTIQHGKPCALRIEMRAAERDV